MEIKPESKYKKNAEANDLSRVIKHMLNRQNKTIPSQNSQIAPEEQKGILNDEDVCKQIKNIAGQMDIQLSQTNDLDEILAELNWEHYNKVDKSELINLLKMTTSTSKNLQTIEEKLQDKHNQMGRYLEFKANQSQHLQDQLNQSTQEIQKIDEQTIKKAQITSNHVQDCNQQVQTLQYQLKQKEFQNMQLQNLITQHENDAKQEQAINQKQEEFSQLPLLQDKAQIENQLQILNNKLWEIQNNITTQNERMQMLQEDLDQSVQVRAALLYKQEEFELQNDFGQIESHGEQQGCQYMIHTERQIVSKLINQQKNNFQNSNINQIIKQSIYDELVQMKQKNILKNLIRELQQYMMNINSGTTDSSMINSNQLDQILTQVQQDKLSNEQAVNSVCEFAESRINRNLDKKSILLKIYQQKTQFNNNEADTLIDEILNSQQSLLRLDSRIKNISQKVNQIKNQKYSVNAKVKFLQQSKKQLEIQYSNRMYQYEQTKRQINSIQAISKQNQQIKEKHQAITKLKSQQQNIINQINEIKQSIELTNNQIQNIQKENDKNLINLNNKKEQLQKQNEEIKNTLINLKNVNIDTDMKNDSYVKQMNNDIENMTCQQEQAASLFGYIEKKLFQMLETPPNKEGNKNKDVQFQLNLQKVNSVRNLNSSHSEVQTCVYGQTQSSRINNIQHQSQNLIHGKILSPSSKKNSKKLQIVSFDDDINISYRADHVQSMDSQVSSRNDNAAFLSQQIEPQQSIMSNSVLLEGSKQITVKNEINENDLKLKFRNATFNQSKQSHHSSTQRSRNNYQQNKLIENQQKILSNNQSMSQLQSSHSQNQLSAHQENYLPQQSSTLRTPQDYIQIQSTRGIHSSQSNLPQSVISMEDLSQKASMTQQHQLLPSIINQDQHSNQVNIQQSLKQKAQNSIQQQQYSHLSSAVTRWDGTPMDGAFSGGGVHALINSGMNSGLGSQTSFRDETKQQAAFNFDRKLEGLEKNQELRLSMLGLEIQDPNIMAGTQENTMDDKEELASHRIHQTTSSNRSSSQLNIINVNYSNNGVINLNQQERNNEQIDQQVNYSKNNFGKQVYNPYNHLTQMNMQQFQAINFDEQMNKNKFNQRCNTDSHNQMNNDIQVQQLNIQPAADTTSQNHSIVSSQIFEKKDKELKQYEMPTFSSQMKSNSLLSTEQQRSSQRRQSNYRSQLSQSRKSQKSKKSQKSSKSNTNATIIASQVHLPQLVNLVVSKSPPRMASSFVQQHQQINSTKESSINFNNHSKMRLSQSTNTYHQTMVRSTKGQLNKSTLNLQNSRFKKNLSTSNLNLKRLSHATNIQSVANIESINKKIRQSVSQMALRSHKNLVKDIHDLKIAYQMQQERIHKITKMKANSGLNNSSLGLKNYKYRAKSQQQSGRHKNRILSQSSIISPKMQTNQSMIIQSYAPPTSSQNRMNRQKKMNRSTNAAKMIQSNLSSNLDIPFSEFQMKNTQNTNQPMIVKQQVFLPDKQWQYQLRENLIGQIQNSKSNTVIRYATSPQIKQSRYKSPNLENSRGRRKQDKVFKKGLQTLVTFNSQQSQSSFGRNKNRNTINLSNMRDNQFMRRNCPQTTNVSRIKQQQINDKGNMQNIMNTPYQRPLTTQATQQNSIKYDDGFVDNNKIQSAKYKVSNNPTKQNSMPISIRNSEFQSENNQAQHAMNNSQHIQGFPIQQLPIQQESSQNYDPHQQEEDSTPKQHLQPQRKLFDEAIQAHSNQDDDGQQQKQNNLRNSTRDNNQNMSSSLDNTFDQTEKSSISINEVNKSQVGNVKTIIELKRYEPSKNTIETYHVKIPNQQQNIIQFYTLIKPLVEGCNFEDVNHNGITKLELNPKCFEYLYFYRSNGQTDFLAVNDIQKVEIPQETIDKIKEMKQQKQRDRNTTNVLYGFIIHLKNESLFDKQLIIRTSNYRDLKRWVVGINGLISNVKSLSNLSRMLVRKR